MGLSSVLIYSPRRVFYLLGSMPKRSGLINRREKDVCFRVKSFRESIRWPQPAFAFELEITKDQLASIEYARTPLRYHVGFNLCFVFNVSQAWLATGTGPVSPSLDPVNWPLPAQLPSGMLFTEAFDAGYFDTAQRLKAEIQTKSGAEKETRQPELVTGDFDPTELLLDNAMLMLKREQFHDEQDRRAFAVAAVHSLRRAWLMHRRKRLRRMVRRGSLMKLTGPTHADLSKRSIEDAKRVLAIRKKIEQLEIDLALLQEEEHDLIDNRQLRQ